MPQIKMPVDEVLNNEDGEYWTEAGTVLYRRLDGSWASTCGVDWFDPEQMRLLVECESLTSKS